MRYMPGALRTLCLADADISALIDTRCWVNSIPKDVIEAANVMHPPKMLVIREAGGFGKADTLPLDRATINILCYGESSFEAARVRRAVWQRFVLLSRETHDDVLIHSINSAGGPIPSIEEDLMWPAVAQSFTVLADVLEIA